MTTPNDSNVVLLPPLAGSGWDDAERFAQHVRHYLLKNLILLDQLVGEIEAYAPDGSSPEWDAVQKEEICKKIREVRSNQVEAVSAAFAKTHTVPHTK